MGLANGKTHRVVRRFTKGLSDEERVVEWPRLCLKTISLISKGSIPISVGVSNHTGCPASPGGILFDLFSIPDMSSECERAFSNAKQFVADYRFNLRSVIILTNQCLKTWFKNDVANGQVAFTNIAAASDEDNVDITGS
jgi:hypothetical protein